MNENKLIKRIIQGLSLFTVCMPFIILVIISDMYYGLLFLFLLSTDQGSFIILLFVLMCISQIGILFLISTQEDTTPRN